MVRDGQTQSNYPDEPDYCITDRTGSNGDKLKNENLGDILGRNSLLGEW